MSGGGMLRRLFEMGAERSVLEGGWMDIELEGPNGGKKGRMMKKKMMMMMIQSGLFFFFWFFFLA